jgi:hypothetical protein
VLKVLQIYTENPMSIVTNLKSSGHVELPVLLREVGLNLLCNQIPETSLGIVSILSYISRNSFHQVFLFDLLVTCETQCGPCF